MKKLKIADANFPNDYYSLDYFYANPVEAQELCKTIFTKVFEDKYERYSLKGLFFTSINRYFLADIKLLEHPLIIKNIIDYCDKNQITKIAFKLHKLNVELYNFYSDSLKLHKIETELLLHNEPVFWKNSLTKESFVLSLQNTIKKNVLIIVQMFLLVFNYFFPKKLEIENRIVFWHSFANNREKIDYPILDNLAKNVTVIHPNPYLFKSQSNWNKSIYLLGKYSINPMLFFNTIFKLTSFRKKFNLLLEEFSEEIPFLPKKWNSSSISKTFFFFVYNLLENGLLENIARQSNLKSVNVFRGGAAAGLIYSGCCKIKYNNKNMINILVPHGTEFNIIDHFSYFFLDYNLLPSKFIKENWEIQLKENYAYLQKYNNCELITSGRIDYQLLKIRENLFTEDKKKITIGIVLTYNSESYQDKYIRDVIDCFENSLGTDNCTFIIKPRPNIVFQSNNYANKNVLVTEGDIYEFMDRIDVVIGTVSTYGILTMVVTDGIYCNIPGLYYLPNPKFNKNNLGYSYHNSMEDYTFNDKKSLSSFVESYNNSADFMAQLWSKNLKTKPYLTFDKDANLFLHDFIISKI
jgi:hypothetical protein